MTVVNGKSVILPVRALTRLNLFSKNGDGVGEIKSVAWPSVAETDTFVDASRLVVPLPLLTDVMCDPVILERFNIIVVFNSFILVSCRNILFFLQHILRYSAAIFCIHSVCFAYFL